MLIKTPIVVAAVAVVLLIAIARQPSAFRVERTVTIAAPASVVFSHIADVHLWTAWSPYEKMDPDARKTYTDGSMHYVGRGRR